MCQLHLSMHGAPAKAIQELAGHENLSTTQRYMHFSPKAVESAIQSLDGPAPAWAVESWRKRIGCERKSPCVYRGEMVEAAGVEPVDTISCNPVIARPFWF